jgi:hypothetical protein
MNIDLAALPDDVDTLQPIVRTLAAGRANLSEAQAEIEHRRLIVQKLQRSQSAAMPSALMATSCGSASMI